MADDGLTDQLDLGPFIRADLVELIERRRRRLERYRAVDRAVRGAGGALVLDPQPGRSRLYVADERSCSGG